MALEFAYTDIMTDKQLVLDTLNKLPDGVPIAVIREEIEILEAIRRGEEAADAGRVVDHAEVKKLAATWRSK